MILVNPNNIKEHRDKLVRGGILWGRNGQALYPMNCTNSTRGHLIFRGGYERLVATRLSRSLK